MKNKDIEKNIKKMISASKSRVWDKVEKNIFQSEYTSLKTVTVYGNTETTLNSKKPFIYSLCAFLIILIAMVSIFAPKLFRKPLDYTGSLYVDINPSLQVIMDKNGLVTEVVPLNEDGLVLLQGHLEYKNIPSEKVVLDIWELAYKSGYISPTENNNALLVTSSFIDESINEKFSLKIKQQLTAKIQEKGVYCAVLTDTLNETIKQKADELGISAGKYQLIKTAIDMGVKFDQSEFASISVAQINERIKEFGKKLDTYCGVDYDGLLEGIQDYVDEQIDLLVNILEECINNIRESYYIIFGDIDNQLLKDEIELDINNLENALEELEKRVLKGEYTKALFDKLDKSINSLSEKHKFIASQLEVLKPMVGGIVEQYNDVIAQITEVKDKIKEKHDRLVSQTEQTINEHIKQNGFEESYEHWLSQVYQDYHENWEKKKHDWNNGRN